MGKDAYHADYDIRNDEIPLAVILGGRIVDEALRGIRFHPPASEIQFRDPRGRKRKDRKLGLFLS